MRRVLQFVFAVLASGAQAQEAEDAGGLYAPSIWDLQLGLHARELPRDDFIDYACGTNGGPPARPLADWRGYERCAPESATELREVYFQYDDELEYWARAHSLDVQTALYQYTSVYEIPVIASGLFDADGFLVGIRMVTDPRVDLEFRQRGADLAGFLLARFDGGWVCDDLPRLEGEEDLFSRYEKRRCAKTAADPDATITIEANNYRKPGQHAVDPLTRLPTVGQFEATTRFEMVLNDFTPDLARVAGLGEQVPSEKDLLIERARGCPGCDLQGVDLKRADLRDANLAGANLAGAKLHGANLNGADLSGANLEKANINRADARRANLSGANLKHAWMYESRFNGADLSGADLTQALAGTVQLNGADLTDATMLAMDLRGARMLNTDLSGADLTYSWMHDAVLTRARLTGATLIEVDLVKADLVEADLSGANLQAVDFLSANLREANLTGADLSYARLIFANLADATLTDAIWLDAELPAGFQIPRN